MGNTVWINNFKEHIGENNMSRPETIETLKIKAEELGVDDGTIRSIFVDGYDHKWLLNDCDKNLKTFGQMLKEFNFKFLNQEGGGEGGTEYCESVIELEGQAYLLSYSYFSHHGYSIDDYWAWKPVTAKQKTVTYYE